MGNSPGLGRHDLRPLETYGISITTGATVLTGRTTIPDAPQPRLLNDAGRWRAVWPRTQGAAGYVVEADSEQRPAILTADTTLTLFRDRSPDVQPAIPRLTVVALDTNLYRYVVDSALARSGIGAGYGVFGAVSWTQIPLTFR